MPICKERGRTLTHEEGGRCQFVRGGRGCWCVRRGGWHQLVRRGEDGRILVLPPATATTSAMTNSSLASATWCTDNDDALPSPIPTMEIRATGKVKDVDNASMHKAEVLDALAAIKLKFPLLKEHIYLNKMNAIAWEEALVNNLYFIVEIIRYSFLTRNASWVSIFA